MRKIITMTFVTLDGVMQAPGGPEEDTSDGFKYGGWQYGFHDQVTGELIDSFMRKPFELLLGRRTYDIFASYWPNATTDREVSVPFNATKKYVVSHSPKELTWKNSYLVTGDVPEQIKNLRELDGPDLNVWGSGNLIQTLLNHDLVDQMIIFTYPIVIGSGKRLFENGLKPQAFRMTDSKVGPAGVVVATYEPAGMFKTGTIGQ